MHKKRLDSLLVERGLVESRDMAERFVMAGQVRVDGQVALKASSVIPENSRLEIDQGPPFVSRGGEKLAAALQTFPINPAGLICADVGASTGGFTDCLLQNGAEKVYAIDVGMGILHWKLRQDKRVVVMEETNARYIARLPEPIHLVTIDASFISLKVLLPVVKNWLAKAANVIALIKPQFEVRYAQASRARGVIRDSVVHRQVLMDVLQYAQTQGYDTGGLTVSPLPGPKGNLEFLTWLVWSTGIALHHPLPDLEPIIQDCLAQAALD